MKTRCPHCQSIMTIPKSYAVSEVKCEQCQQKFTPKEHKTRQHANWGIRIGIGVVLFLGILLIISVLVRLKEQNRILEAKVHKLKQEDSQKSIKQVTRAEQSKSPKKLPRKYKSIARPITKKPLQYSSGQISNLQFLDIRNNMKVMTEAQWKAYVRTLEGKIIDWKGWIEEVNVKFFGGYELWIDMDSPHITASVQDVTFDIPASLALKFNKDQIVYFRGRIKSIHNIVGVCSINLENAAVSR